MSELESVLSKLRMGITVQISAGRFFVKSRELSDTNELLEGHAEDGRECKEIIPRMALLNGRTVDVVHAHLRNVFNKFEAIPTKAYSAECGWTEVEFGCWIEQRLYRQAGLVGTVTNWPEYDLWIKRKAA